MKKKNQKSIAIVYAKQIVPLLSDIILIILSFIPCIRFRLDNDTRQTISLLELLSNAWGESRRYLFSAQTQKTPDGELFYTIVFTALIVCVLLFFVGVIAHIYGMIAFFSDKSSKSRNLYLTLIPNRIVSIALRLLVLPVIFFPEILLKLYRSVLFYSVRVEYTLLPLWIIAAVFFVATATLTLLSKPYERRIGMNIFAKNDNYTADKISNQEFEESSDTEVKRYDIKKPSGKETDSLRKLLGYSDKDNK